MSKTKSQNSSEFNVSFFYSCDLDEDVEFSRDSSMKNNNKRATQLLQRYYHNVVHKLSNTLCFSQIYKILDE